MCNWDLGCCGAPELTCWRRITCEDLGLAGIGCGKGVPSGVLLLRHLGVWTVPVPIQLTKLCFAPIVWMLLVEGVDSNMEDVCLKMNFKLQKSLDPFLQKRIMEYGLAVLVPM